MSGISRTEAVRSLFTAYKTKDRPLIEDLLSDDFTFTSPYDDAIDKAAYFERCWPTSDLFRSHELVRIMEEGDDVFVLYDCVMRDGAVQKYGVFHLRGRKTAPCRSFLRGFMAGWQIRTQDIGVTEKRDEYRGIVA